MQRSLGGCVLGCLDHSSYREARRKPHFFGSLEHSPTSHWGTFLHRIEHKPPLPLVIFLPIFSAIPSSLQRVIRTRCILSAPWRRLCLPHWARIWETWHTALVVVRTCWEETFHMESSSLWKSVFTSCFAAGALKRSWIETKESESKVLIEMWGNVFFSFYSLTLKCIVFFVCFVLFFWRMRIMSSSLLPEFPAVEDE